MQPRRKAVKPCSGVVYVPFVWTAYRVPNRDGSATDCQL